MLVAIDVAREETYGEEGFCMYISTTGVLGSGCANGLAPERMYVIVRGHAAVMMHPK